MHHQPSGGLDLHHMEGAKLCRRPVAFCNLLKQTAGCQLWPAAQSARWCPADILDQSEAMALCGCGKAALQLPWPCSAHARAWLACPRWSRLPEPVLLEYLGYTWRKLCCHMADQAMKPMHCFTSCKALEPVKACSDDSTADSRFLLFSDCAT